MLKRLVDGRADLYSLGVVLFHMRHRPAAVRRRRRRRAAAPAHGRRPTGRPRPAARAVRRTRGDRRQAAGQGPGRPVPDRRRPWRPTCAPLAGGTRRRPGAATTAPATTDAPLVGRAAELRTAHRPVVHARWPGTAASPWSPGRPAAARAGWSASCPRPSRRTAPDRCTASRSPDDPVPMGPMRAAVERYLACGRPPAGAGPRGRARERVRAAAGRGASAARHAVARHWPRCWPRRSSPTRTGRSSSRSSVATFLVGLARAAGGRDCCAWTTCSGWTPAPGGCCTTSPTTWPTARCWWSRPPGTTTPAAARTRRSGPSSTATVDTRIVLASTRRRRDGPARRGRTSGGARADPGADRRPSSPAAAATRSPPTSTSAPSSTPG